MKRLIVSIVLLIIASNLEAQQLAFPTASGAGAYATGGRGGTVLHVDTLYGGESNTDATHGSFLWALKQDYPRTIVFDVGGVIDNRDWTGNYVALAQNSTYNGRYNDLTIAGQTAPGGITFEGHSFFIDRIDNMIIRYIRINHVSADGYAEDAAFIRTNNTIIDHCSWHNGKDENISIYDTVYPIGGVSFQYNLLGNGKTGMIVGARDAVFADATFSINNNLFVQISHRFPNTSGYSDGQFEVINNVVYGGKLRYISMNGSGGTPDFSYVNINYVNNYNKLSSFFTSAYGVGYAQSNFNVIQEYNLDPINKNVHSGGNIVTGWINTPQATDFELWTNFDFAFGGDTYWEYEALNKFTVGDGLTATRLGLLGHPLTIKTAADAYTDVLANSGANAYLNDSHVKVNYTHIHDENLRNHVINDDVTHHGGYYATDANWQLYLTETGTHKLTLYNANGGPWLDGTIKVWVDGSLVVDDDGSSIVGTSGYEITFEIPSTSSIVRYEVDWNDDAFENKAVFTYPSTAEQLELVHYLYPFQTSHPVNGKGDQITTAKGGAWQSNAHISGYTRPVGWDTDDDGMPDSWEVTRWGDITTSNGKTDLDANGYTELEDYLNIIDGEIADIDATGVTVTPTTATINIPDTVQLYSTVDPNATDQSGTWSVATGHESVATISANGLVTPVSVGDATMTFTSTDGGFTDSSVITVTNIVNDLISVDVDPENQTLTNLDQIQMTLTFTPTDASTKTGVWSSDAPSIATVDSNGLVTPLQDGVVNITFTPTDQTNSAIDTTEFTISLPTGATIVIPISLDLGDVKEDDNGYIANSNIELGGDYETTGTWTNAFHFSTAQVPAGKVIQEAKVYFICDAPAQGTGTLNLLVKIEDSADPTIYTTTRYDVSGRTYRPETVAWNTVSEWNTLDQSYGSVDISSLIQLHIDDPSYDPNNGINIIFEWSSGEGQRSAYSHNYDNAKAPELHITYDEGAGSTPVTSVSVQLSKTSVVVGQGSQGTETVLPNDASDKTGVWASSNESVATVDQQGAISTYDEGITQISFLTTDGSFSDSAQLTVTAPPSIFQFFRKTIKKLIGL